MARIDDDLAALVGKTVRSTEKNDGGWIVLRFDDGAMFAVLWEGLKIDLGEEGEDDAARDPGRSPAG